MEPAAASSQSTLDAHEAPPTPLKEIFKKYQKIKQPDLVGDCEVLDFSIDSARHTLLRQRDIPGSELADIFSQFTGSDVVADTKSVFYHDALPGLLMVPDLMSLQTQKCLLSRLIHRDLSHQSHKTNVHMHYDPIYPESMCNHGDLDDDMGVGESSATTYGSFFSYSPKSSVTFPPKDPSVHKPLSILKFLNKSLRWITLGGQYDWTQKVYPDEMPPSFPSDIGSMLGRIFPEMKPQAAIVNIYSPGDTLSLHRDVSEKVDKGLVSISIGCDCLFIIGLHDRKDTLVIRLRSGDAVYMSKEARFAWHGVPRILPDTCPAELQDWPAEDLDGKFGNWRGWMSRKRINLNVRQMFDE